MSFFNFNEFFNEFFLIILMSFFLILMSFFNDFFFNFNEFF